MKAPKVLVLEDKPIFVKALADFSSLCLDPQKEIHEKLESATIPCFSRNPNTLLVQHY